MEFDGSKRRLSEEPQKQGGVAIGLGRLEVALKRFAAPTRYDDIQKVNECLLLIASDLDVGPHVLRQLGASEAVASRLRSANSKGIATAVRCGVPLVRFTMQFEQLVMADPRGWRIAVGEDVREELKRLTSLCLFVAQGLTLRNVGMAKMLFGVTRLVAERLGDLAVVHHETLIGFGRPLVRLCAGSDFRWWDRILIGERCGGPKAFRIARYTAQQSLETR